MIISREQPRWVPPAVILAAVAAGYSAYFSPIAGAALSVLVLGIVLLLRPAVAIPLLIVASAFNRFGLNWGDSRIRVDIVAAILLAAVLADRLAVRTVRPGQLRSPLLLPFAAYLASNVFSSLFFAMERVRGLKLSLEIASALLAYLVVTVLLVRKQDLRAAVRALWVVTVAEAAFGLIALILFVGHAGSFGVQIGDLGVPMVYGTLWEANIFGSFLLGNFFILLADHVARGRSWPRSVGLVVVVAGIAASMTRTVWLGLILGCILFVGLSLRSRYSGTALAPVLVGAPILALLGLLAGAATPFAGRLLDVVNLQTSSASGRLTLYRYALTEWQHRPIFGNGTGSFNIGAAPGTGHAWLPSLFLMTLHDAGLVGFAALAWLIVAFYRYTWKGLSGDRYLSLLVMGSIASFTSLLLAFQTTTGFWFAYPWIVAGIGVVAARLQPDGA